MYKYIVIFEIDEKIEVYTFKSKTEFIDNIRYLVDSYYTRIHIFYKRQFERSRSKIVLKARSLMKDEKCKRKISWCKSTYKYSYSIKMLNEAL